MHIVNCTCGMKFVVRGHKGAPEQAGSNVRGVAECPECHMLQQFDEVKSEKIQEGAWHGRETIRPA